MPAAVNTFDQVSGATATITTPGVTPGGVDRAIYTFNISADSVYSTEAKYTDNSGAAITDETGSSIQMDIFAFLFAYTKSYGEAGSPNTATTIYTEFSAAILCAAIVFYLEDVDQTTPFDAEEIGTEVAISSDPQTVTDTFTGLTPGQLVIGCLYIYTIGDNGPVSITAGGDVEVNHGEEAITVEAYHLNIVGFSGHADGSGDFAPSFSVNMPNAGELATALIVCRPIVDAAGGDELDVTLSISGGYVFSGAAPFTRTRLQGVSGGIAFSGTAPISFDGVQIYTITPSGGYALSGAAPLLFTHVIPVSGGIVFSGTVPFGFTKTLTPSGGIDFSGAAPMGRTKVFAPAGGIVFSGSSPISFTPAGSGGVGDGSPLRMVGIGVAN